MTGEDMSREDRLGLLWVQGYVLAGAGRHDEAAALYAGLQQEATRNGNRPLEHAALHQVGMVRRMAGRWKGALACFEEERGLIERLGTPPLAVSVNAYELGWVLLHLHRPAEARTWFDLCLESAGRSGDLVALGCAHRGLGDWFREQGALEQAQAHWDAARAAFTATNDEAALRDLTGRS